MRVIKFTANAEKDFGFDAGTDRGYRVLSYSGSLGGGTLRVFTQVQGGAKTPVPDSKLTAATVDDNGDAVQQMAFMSVGNIWVHLTGATAPDVDVTVA